MTHSALITGVGRRRGIGAGTAVIALTSDHTVGNLVRFLPSDHGQWINGQLLYSNGDFPEGRLPL